MVSYSDNFNIQHIYDLVEQNILGSEELPEVHYWHWSVKQPEKLPDWAKDQYLTYGEVRYYWC